MNTLFYLAQLLDPGGIDIPRGQFDGSVLKLSLQLVTGVAAAAAFIMIVIAGFKYTLSRGNPDEVSKAKDTIIYALVGLILAMSAFSVVTFVIGQL